MDSTGHSRSQMLASLVKSKVLQLMLIMDHQVVDQQNQRRLRNHQAQVIMYQHQILSSMVQFRDKMFLPNLMLQLLLSRVKIIRIQHLYFMHSYLESFMHFITDMCQIHSVRINKEAKVAETIVLLVTQNSNKIVTQNQMRMIHQQESK